MRITLLRIFRGSSRLYVVINISHSSFLIPHLLRLFADVCQDTTIDIEHVAVDGVGSVRS